MSEQHFESARPSQGDDASSDDVLVNGGKQVSLPDISGILDQIDAVLEKNSEDFVSGFVQKGGQ